MIRIVLVDDHAIVRKGFRALINDEDDMNIVAECCDADEARDAVLTHAPEVLALDLSMPGSGLSLADELHTSVPNLLLLVLSMHDREPYISEALRRGVRGYVTKCAATDELVIAIRAIHEGRIYLSSDIHQPTPWTALAALSERENEVFLLLAKGMTPKHAALDLGISPKTVYLHRDTIRAKLGARNDFDLNRIALESGLL